MMKSVVANTILESSDKKFTNPSARKTVVTKLKKANVERSGIVKVTGHKTIQSLDDYDEANEEEQGQLSYAISGRNNFNPQPTVSREVHGQQELLASSAQFLQPPRARIPLQPISMPNSSAFGLKQSSTALNPTMMRAQEQNLLNTFQLLPGFIQLQGVWTKPGPRPMGQPMGYSMGYLMGYPMGYPVGHPKN